LLARIPARTGGSDEAGKYSSDLESVKPTQFALLISPACGEAGGRLHTFFIMKSNNPYAFIRPVCACVFSLSIVCEIQAQEKNDSTKLLPPVVVTAARIEQLQTDALPHTTIITASDIKNSQAVDVVTLLRREAGLQLTQSGGLGGASGIFMRGASTNQTLILIDGIPMTKQDATGTVSIEHLMLDQIDRIEIVRGNVSSIYGSGAVGGVIQIFTKAGSGTGGTQATAEIGSNSFRRVAASTGGQSDGLRYSFAVSDVATAGFSAVNTTQKPRANPDRDSYSNLSANGLIAKSWATGHEFGLRFMNSTGRFDFDSSYNFVSDLPSDIHIGKTELNSINFFSNNKISENWNSKIAISDFNDKNSNQYLISSPRNDSYKTRVKIIEWNNEIKISKNFRLNLGTNNQWQSINADDGFAIDNLSRKANSFYGGIEGVLIDKHQLQINVRHDATEKNESAKTGFIGYGYNLNDKLKYTASASTGFNMPSLGYVAGTYGNPDLKPEYSKSFETGLQYYSNTSIVRISLFKSNIADQIVYDDVTRFTFLNMNKVINEGLEVSASQEIMGWSTRSSLTMQDPRNADTGERLRRRAALLGSLSANRMFGNFRFGGDLAYTGSRPDIDNNNLRPYWLAGITARYQVNKSYSLFGRIDNVLNENYQTAFGFNQPSRGLFVGLNWQQ
jgi:vitamin B12 transporter